jgi:hypothetical protein
MKTMYCLLAVALAAVISVTCLAAGPDPGRKVTLSAFASEEELSSLFKKWQEEGKRRQAEMRVKQSETALSEQAAPSVAPSAAAKSEAKAGESGFSDSVTNTQTAGVDEGGIVKVHGKHLVVLRRGRIFTVAIDDNQLKPVAAIDAFGPDIEPRGAWYDEMLISGNTVVVIGYSYARGGTEVGIFDIDQAGGLRYRATHHLRSNDYYSSRNYASRLIGTKLIFYTPLYVNMWGADPYASFPAYRKWRGKEASGEFHRIAPATRIYRTDDELDPWSGLALHTVTVCDFSGPEMDCRATAVLGPPGRVFYVSGQSVYVWTTNWRQAQKENRASSSVFRIPLDGGAPSALKTAGSPIDQFSFLESDDGHLNVMLRANGRGEAMWASERGSGDIALLRVPLSSFGDGRDSAPPESYRNLPAPKGFTMQNRYVGPFLLYGAGASWGRPKERSDSPLYALRWAERAEAIALPLSHGVDRIEALGGHALVVGANGPDLHFSSIRLNGTAGLAHRYIRAEAAQGETRSHGFFYKPETATGGMLGLPVRGGGEAGHRQLREESAAVLFLKNSNLKLYEMGALDSTPGAGEDDGCRASCVDWYGNSRPLFLGGRVFALMGYELVEGRVETSGRNAHILEVRRINFAPRGPTESEHNIYK